MDEHKVPFFKAALTWIAAALSAGSFLGFVNLVVGVVSAVWVIIQLIDYVRYKRPVIKAEHAKLKAISK